MMKQPSTKRDWITAALSNDVVVAELLIRMKQQPSTTTTTFLPSITWGHRESRSKPKPSSAAAAVNGSKKEQQSGSPTTPLCWSTAGASTSDCYDESSRPSDLSSGGYRSNKGNEGATTSSYNKSRKRKSYDELKEEQDFLLKERLHLNRIDMHQIPNKEEDKMINHPVQISWVMEHETKAHETGFVLPDLNMTPGEEELCEEMIRV